MKRKYDMKMDEALRPPFKKSNVTVPAFESLDPKGVTTNDDDAPPTKFWPVVPAQRAGFFDLPPELRDDIYDRCDVKDIPYVVLISLCHVLGR